VVSSRKSSKSTECGTPVISGSCSSRSLATTDGGELPLSRMRMSQTPSVEEQFEEIVPVDWSCWGSTDAAANANSDSKAQPMASARSEADPGVPATNVTDDDTSTFNLTSGTVHFAANAPKQQPSHGPASARRRVAAGLPTVAEDDAGADLGETAELAALANGSAIVDDAYAEDLDAMDALARIDEQLQRYVPEQEWEAKSICSFPSRHTGSVAGDSASGVSHVARSVWSRASGGSAMPRDPMLCEQFEKRESELALVSIDNRLNEIQCDQASTNEPPNAVKLKALLMQAAQETAAPDAEARVMALTGTAPLNLKDDSSMNETLCVRTDPNSLVPMAAPGASYPDSGLLSKARQILMRLENDDGEWTDAFGEAQNSMSLLEQELQHLESEELASRPGTGAVAGSDGPEATSEPQEPCPSALAPFSERLEEIHSQVASVLARRGATDEDLIARLRDQLERGDDGEPKESELLLPALGASAGGGAVSDALDGEGTSDNAGFAGDIASSDGFEAWHSVREGPNLELLKALELELPASDGVWDDAELERACGSMNAHFGDVPVEVALGAYDEAESEERASGSDLDAGDDCDPPPPM